MYESESRAWSIAARIARARIRALPEFAEYRAALVSHALVTCRGKSVAQMRELGGFSSVLHMLIDGLPASADTNVGSKLLPSSVRTELRGEVPAMREDVQRALANEKNGATATVVIVEVVS